MPDYTPTGKPQDETRGIAKQVRDEFTFVQTALNSKSEKNAYVATSTTSLLIGTGTKTLTVETGKSLVPGMNVFLAYTVSPTVYNMTGQILTYDPLTGVLQVSISAVTGTGTFASWSVGLSNSNGVTLAANTFTGPQNFARATVASAATTSDIWNANGNQIDFTGVATVTGFPAAIQGGMVRELICAAGVAFTAGANMLIDGYSSGETMTCAANDKIIVRAVSTTQFNISRIRYDGRSQVPVKNSLVIVHSGNGNGATNTKIRRWTTILSNIGTAITYADSATLGGSFTINEPGIYAVMVLDGSSGAAVVHGISLNSSQLSTSISSITAADRLAIASITSSDAFIPCSIVTRLVQGDVIRAHNNGFASPATTADKSMFSIRKIADA